MKNNAITQGSIFKGIMKYFFPIWFGTFFQQLYNTVDAIVVGNFVGKEALGAVGGSTGTIINLIVGLFVGLSSGATVVISQHFGSKNTEATSRSVHTSVALAIAGGSVMTVVGIFASPVIMNLMGTPTDILPFALSYIRIYFCGSIFMFVYNVGSGILRAIGDSKRPLYFLIVSSLINVVLDIAFVVGLKMGVAGAGLATIMSQAVSAVLVIASLAKSRESYRFERAKLKIHKDVVKDIVRIGVPAGLQSVMYSFSNLVIQGGINLFGTSVVAAWSAYGKIDGLFWMTVQSFGISVTTFSGQNFGARNYDRMKKSVRVCLTTSMCFTAVLSTILIAFAPYLYRMFTPDTEVVSLGIELMMYLVPFYFTFVPIEILSGALRGAGDSLIPTIITCMGVCVLRVAWIWFVLPGNLTLFVACLSYPITWSITSVLFIIYYFQGSWLKRCKKLAGHIEA